MLENNSKQNLYGVKLPFPFKLHEMLSSAMKEDTEDIVSWQPHGKAFRVHKPKEFVEGIMQRYFRQSQYKSFQRQLHIYGFRRILKGLDKGAYYHPMFIRGMEAASFQMTRHKIKGLSANVEIEDPNFYQQQAAPTVMPDKVEAMTVPWKELSSSCIGPQIMPPTTPPVRADNDEVSNDLSLQALSKLFHLLEKEQHQVHIHDMVLQDNGDFFQPAMPLLLMSTHQKQNHRRGSLFEEGDEAFFAGKKFHLVKSPSSVSLLTVPHGEESRRRTPWAMGA